MWIVQSAVDRGSAFEPYCATRMGMFVQPAGIFAISDSVCEIAENLAIATREWSRELSDCGSAFGLRDAAGAVAAMRDAWHADFGVYRAVIEEWCLATKAAAAGFRTVNEYIAAEVAASYPPREPV